MDFARRRGEQIEEVALDQVVRDALRLTRYDPRARGVSIEADVPRALPLVKAREDDLVLVLVNLILNAFAAMPDGGTLSIRAELCSNGEIVLSVTDTGTGFEPELDRTSQPSSTPQSVSTGRGFGLAICTDIMHAGGGRLELRSEAGRGTTASLVFPLDAARGE